MHKTLKDFLAATHFDEADKLAQRALKIHVACLGISGLIANAYNRGDGEAYNQVCQAHYEASLAFIAINQSKSYAFAKEVLDQLAVQSVETDQPVEVATYFVDKAEKTIAGYAERCKPVCRIIGVKSVRILRGEHALHAMKDLVPANAA